MFRNGPKCTSRGVLNDSKKNFGRTLRLHQKKQSLIFFRLCIFCMTPIRYSMDYNDNSWDSATEWSEDDVGWGQTPDPGEGIDPQTVDWGNASFIWGDDLDLDNKLICRYSYS